MEIQIDRYNLQNSLVSNGTLTIEKTDRKTTLTYQDKEINVSGSALYYPLKALEDLRLKLENQYNSTLAIIGCRTDTAFRPTGGQLTFILENGQYSLESKSLFETTDQIKKLGTVKKHKLYYKAWCNEHEPK
jgi:hypothetical protein